ncbi:hypothetical protein HDIA_1346 [Hartmannibacter diazotrophicus]|uniref:Phage tail tape measure protein, lambda family n=1 Tax=Hartmannibacter diazotrophicus TaxID=1482074 RepID=A0A2C9D3I2_9HYPH|nr:phage tail tape measure protein [Hartmannibacter diazotrophicus]SON54887.1 hypothetical protein HDIA_1346 [Hartmannibacter diazotrophicus]
MALEGNDLAEFDQQAGTLRNTLLDLDRISSRFSSSLSRGLASAVVEGRSLDQVMKQLALNLSSNVLNSALQPLTRSLSGVASGLFGAFSGAAASSVVPFATGGVVASPGYFPLGDGRTGLAGEAGAEAILPLTRGPDGRLGVSGEGGRTNVTFQVNTPDAESFRRSEGQITALLARAVSRGRRTL